MPLGREQKLWKRVELAAPSSRRSQFSGRVEKSERIPKKVTLANATTNELQAATRR